MSSTDLLRELNCVFHTNHRLNTAGVSALLEGVRRSSPDFGEVYGMVRQCWRRPGTIKALYKKQCTREAQHEVLRRNATRGAGLANSHIPPRRVWDLYSNRVLPLAVIPTDDPEPSNIPDALVTVSHSWVAEPDRADLWTPVNGKRWPVPFPRATTLEHVRVELLNMGLEYVWLDVLCLRQQGREEDEARRREEWKIDVPTIGYIYQGRPQVDHRACVIYFNGLGLPLDTSPAALASDRHWFSRAWTLQESLEFWVPGGLTGAPLAAADAFLARLRAAVNMGAEVGPIRRLVPDVVREIMRRACTKALDRIAGLAYCLECDTLPLYDEGAGAERAWALLLKHVEDGVRTRLSLLCAARGAPYALFPTWAEYATGTHSQENLTSHGSLRLVDEDQRFTAQPGQYYNEGIVFGPCRFSLVPSEPDPTDLRPTLRVSPVDGQAQSITVRPGLIHGVVLENTTYSLVRWSGDGWRTPICWAIVEEFARQETPEPVVVVARSAVMLLYYDDNENLQGLWTTDDELEPEWAVMYVSGEEALQKSRHRRRYMAALESMQATGETFVCARR
ncbi:heterokaryon incompatibility protein [Phanerochaete sordida]|uniref:Heterokaryon incompatibility protein n=1 Tax=Phanerochaete sordida TaxID=48140 RepID=A0A9P3L6R7_9APHY|nr:heterokaryon incompatibility protein [Phanerochaete sordida]